jgi:hypothetical protein
MDGRRMEARVLQPTQKAASTPHGRLARTRIFREHCLGRPSSLIGPVIRLRGRLPITLRCVGSRLYGTLGGKTATCVAPCEAFSCRR